MIISESWFSVWCTAIKLYTLWCHSLTEVTQCRQVKLKIKINKKSGLLKSLFVQHVHCCSKHVYHILDSVANRLTLCQRSWTRCRAGSRSIWTEESGQEVMYWNRWPWEPSVFSLAVQQCGALLTRYKQQHRSVCDTAHVCLLAYLGINYSHT